MSKCVIDAVDDGDMAEIWNTTEPVARKEHSCFECKKTIQIGEKYERVDVIWKTWQTIKTCSVCLELRKLFFCSYCAGNILEDLRQEIWEYDLDLGCLNGMSPQAISMISGMLEAVNDE